MFQGKAVKGITPAMDTIKAISAVVLTEERSRHGAAVKRLRSERIERSANVEEKRKQIMDVVQDHRIGFPAECLQEAGGTIVPTCDYLPLSVVAPAVLEVPRVP